MEWKTTLALKPELPCHDPAKTILERFHGSLKRYCAGIKMLWIEKNSR